MKKWVNISVPEDVKRRLMERKGNQTWGDYLLDLAKTGETAKRKEAYRKLRELLTEEDFENMRESSRKFREEFTLDRE